MNLPANVTWSACAVAPETRYWDEFSEVVPAGWWVTGTVDGDPVEDGPRYLIHIGQQVDDDGNDLAETIAHTTAAALNTNRRHLAAGAKYVPRPALHDPNVNTEWDEDRDELVAESVGWALSWGCNLTFGPNPDGHLVANVSTSDADQRAGITQRAVTPEQICTFARMLLDRFEKETGQ